MAGNWWDGYPEAGASPSAAGSNWWDAFPAANDKAGKPAAGLLRGAADSALALGTGVVQGVKMLSDVAGADNAVSRRLGGAADALSDLESPARKAERQARAEKIRQAEASGSTWEEVKAHVGAFTDAPLDTTLSALGTSVPTLAVAMIPGAGQAALATRVAQAGLGAAQGVGNIKGQIHEAVKQRHLEAGVSEEEATARADAAQAYAGENAGSIALGGALGGLAGSTGAESAVRRLVGRGAAAQAAEQAAPGVMRSAVRGALAEAPMESAQGGQERYSSNVALQREGFDVPTWQGVAGQAALEGIAAAPLGGGFGALEGMGARGHQPMPSPAADAADPGMLNAEGGATQPAAVQQMTEAERALRAPAQLTALDRAQAIDSELAGLHERQVDLTPENGYGPAFDAERQDLATQAAELERERAAISATWPRATHGAATSFSTEAGVKLDGQYALMDADDLQTSHDEYMQANPLYPAELQPRDRGRHASEMQVQGISQKLDPARLGVSADAATGAPIVGADGLVESGNGRTIALKRIYRVPGAKAAEYRQWLRDSAAQFGLTPEAVEGMAKPVLVRVRSTPVNRAEFARQANASTVQRMAPSEQALSDARRLTSLEGLQSDEDGDFTGSRDFIRQFMAGLPITEQADLVEADGRLSTAGYRRIQNAVLAKAYGDSATLRRMTESLDNNLANISKALTRVAPTIAAARERMDAGTLHQADIAPDLLQAVEGLSALKEKGWTAAQELGQQDLAGPRYTPEAAMLLEFLADNARSPRRIAEFLQRYYEELERSGDPSQPSMFGDDTPAPARGELLKQARGPQDGDAAQNPKRGIDREGARPDAQAGGEPTDAPGRGRGDQGDAAAQADAGRGQQGEQQGQASGEQQSTWVAFPPDSGTLGIPRAEMPQVKAEHRSALAQFLRARGIDYVQDEMAPDRLRPTQAEYAPGKVERATAQDGERSVLVAADGHILDGHHQWMAHKEAGTPVPVLRFAAPIGELLQTTAEFPSAEKASGATPAARPAARADARLSRAKAGSGGSLAEVKAEWSAMGIEAYISESRGQLNLSTIKVPKEARNQGTGTRAMRLLVEYADRTGQRITLSPSSDFGSSKARLIQFYKRLGFVENKGRNKDFSISETMYREPAASDDTRLSRDGAPVGVRVETLQALVAHLRKAAPNLPTVHVLNDPADAPYALRAYINKQDAWHDVDGAMHEGELYLFAANLPSIERAEHVLIEHEAGHFGLRAILGPQGLHAAMNLIWAQNARVRREATVLQQRGSLSDSAATEEVIVDIPSAELAQLKGWRKVVLRVRDWLAGRGYERTAERLTDWLNGSLSDQQRADLFVADLMRAARDYVAGKRQGSPAGYLGVTRLSGALADALARRQMDTDAAAVLSRARDELGKLATMAVQPGNANRTVNLGPVSEGQIDLLVREGIPVTAGFTHSVDMFAVRHALNRHSDAKVEAKQGQLPLGDADVAAIPQVIASADALLLGAKTPRGQDIVGSLKRLPDGTVLYLEEVRSGRKTLAMTSMRKYPGTTDFETIKNRIVPSYAQSDTGDARIVYPDGPSGQDGPLLSRSKGGPAFNDSNATVVADFLNDSPLKAHPDYKAAKAGDVEAAVRLVRDLVKPESLAAAREQFGPDAVFVPVHTEEASGRNKIPMALAARYAEAAGAAFEPAVVQSNKAFHTGADPMQRLIARAEFAGPIQKGARYVLVDDVTTMGSTLADLAAYIQRNGGEVAGSVVLVNAMRGGKIQAPRKLINQLEARHGDAIRELFEFGPEGLTGPEAQYLVGFRTADELRTRVAKAGRDRSSRLDAKALSGRPDPETRLSRAQPAAAAPATAAERAEQIISTPVTRAAPLDAAARAVTRLTGLDRLAGGIYNRAALLLDRYTPEKIKAGVVADYGVPEAVIDQRTMLQGRQRVQLRKAGSLIEKLSTLTRAESRVAYEWMNSKDGEVSLAGLPEGSAQVLGEIRQFIDRLSREAVRMGQLSPEAYERNRFTYLRRSYAKHLLEQTKAQKAKRSRTIALLGEQYRGRGLSEQAPMAQLRREAPQWWGRKLQEGKADAGLKGERFLRLERRAPTGEGTKPLEGMDDKAIGKLQEVVYWPADEAVPARLSEWTQEGTWEVRDVKGANVVFWRDFTKAEREKMGEVDEARFAIAKTLQGMIHDVEVGRYLEWLAHNQAKKPGEAVDGKVVEASERMRDTFAPDEWVQVPETKVAGTSALKYGKLAGRFIPGPVWNDLRQVAGGKFQPFGETYARILTMWKTSKTALSPGVHMNNVMSNFVMADWHDVHAAHIAKALGLLVNASRKTSSPEREAAAEVLTRYKDSGGDAGSWATQEIAREQLEPLLASVQREMAAGDEQAAQVGVFSALQHASHARFGQAWEAAVGSKPGKGVQAAAGAMLDLYQAEDDVFRLAAWLRAKEEGSSDLEAGKAARKSFLDYQINAPWISAMRASAWPFFSFTYRAVPMLAEIAGKKPHKLMKLMALAGALNALGVALGGGGDDDERKLLPEEKAGGIWGMVPKLIRMPWNDAHGSPVYLDIRRWIPVGDVFDVGQGHSAIPLLPGLMPGGPLVLAGEVVLNRSSFTGKPITLETDTPTQQAAKLGDYLYKAFAPNVLGLPGTYATTGVMGSMTGRTDAFGRELSTPQSLASAVGVKLGSYPADVLRRNQVAATLAQTSEIDKNIAQLKRQLQTGRIDADELRDAIKVEQEKKVKLMRKLAEAAQ